MRINRIEDFETFEGDFGDFSDLGFQDFGALETENIIFEDFDTSEFEKVGETTALLKSRYMKPKLFAVKKTNIRYDNAIKLANDLTIGKGERYELFVSGDFIFGDLIEAYIKRHNLRVEHMQVCTLSLSRDNVDSFRRLMKRRLVEKLDLLVSAYFYSHEKLALIPYIYDELDCGIGDFQLAVAGVHTKTVTMKTAHGLYLVMHGSANLRSSGNIEQCTFEESLELYKFYVETYSPVIEEYKTINKEVRYAKLWKRLGGNKTIEENQN